MRAGLVLTNQGTECQCQDTEKTNEESMMLESLRRVRVIQSVKIRLSYTLTAITTIYRMRSSVRD